MSKTEKKPEAHEPEAPKVEAEKKAEESKLAKYRVGGARLYVNDRLYAPGDEIEMPLDWIPSITLTPLNDAATAALAKRGAAVAALKNK